ncbi:MAG: hypothetical protein C5B59_20515 [Bacteroidetes bacterium]|nr:MAG: hypothetical protein C5B59_20515 [Bacteroidota bacterium]
MKNLFPAFDSFFGDVHYEPSSEPKSSSVTLTSLSQPNVLQRKMKEEKMSHGGTVKATLSPVRLEMSPIGVVMYFCPMKSLQILETIAEGDGENIPAQAKVEDLQVPSDFKSGFYELENIELTSNGTIQVKATEKTSWKLIAKTLER